MSDKNLHDRLFKLIMAEKEEALSLVNAFLPKSLTDNIDEGSFKKTPTSFIDKKLDEHFTDIVYESKWKNGGSFYISFLFEHKSYYDKYTYLQLLRYLLKTYEEKFSKLEKGKSMPFL